MGYNQNPTNDELTKTFRDFCDLFNRLQLNFFIQCGTLLGYTRENDFIAWDYDIDIGMFYKDFKGKEKMIIDELERNYWFLWIQHGQYDSNFNIQFIHPTTRVRVDLDIVYPILTNNNNTLSVVSNSVSWVILKANVFKAYKSKSFIFYRLSF